VNGHRLYDVERQYAHAAPADRLDTRRIKSAPLLQEFLPWLYQTGADITPKSALGQAVNYAIKNLDGLEVYLSDS
jgi:transposase